MKKITLAICLFISIASNSQIAQIFSNTTDTGFVAQVVDSTIIVKQNISININKIKTQGNDTLRIQLPGITTPVQIIKTRQSINNTLNSFEWFGEIQGSPNSFVLFTTVGSAVAGYIRDNNKIYRVQYKGNNVHQIASINNKYAKPDKVMHRGSIVDSSYTTDTASCCDTTKEVDVLVVYTVEAGRAAGGTDGMNATIDLCIELSNQSYINSGINVRQNLVHTEEINYADQNNAETNLSRITSNPGGIFNNVYTLRNTYSADIVVMMVDMMYGYSGIANVMTTNTVAFESNAFATVYQPVIWCSLMKSDIYLEPGMKPVTQTGVAFTITAMDMLVQIIIPLWQALLILIELNIGPILILIILQMVYLQGYHLVLVYHTMH